jgi:hypothetical protein
MFTCLLKSRNAKYRIPEKKETTQKLDITRQFISSIQSVVIIIITPSGLLDTFIRNVRGLNVSWCASCLEWDFY